MENNKFGIFAAIILILLIGFGYFSSSKTEKTNTESTHMMHGEMMENVDQNFIENVIPHHDGAIAMAKIALEKSTNPEIRSLSVEIIKAQEKENVEMRKWYKEWFGTEVVGSTMGHMNSMGGDLEKLKNAEDFDSEFIRQMLPHHEMAIMMATMLKRGTNRPEMLQLADNIITSQSREIDMMRSWIGL